MTFICRRTDVDATTYVSTTPLKRHYDVMCLLGVGLMVFKRHGKDCRSFLTGLRDDKINIR